MAEKLTCSKCVAHVNGTKAVIELCEVHGAAYGMKAAIRSCLALLNRHNPATGFNLAAESSELTAMSHLLTAAHLLASEDVEDATGWRRRHLGQALTEADKAGIDRRWRENQEMYAARRKGRVYPR